MSEMRANLHVIQGGGETVPAIGDLTPLYRMKPHVEYKPETELAPRPRNGLWPLTPVTMHLKMETMTEEEERRAAGVEDFIPANEQIYVGGEL